MRLDPGEVSGTALERGGCEGSKEELVCRMAHSTKGINSEGHAQENLLAKTVGKVAESGASVFVGTLGAAKCVSLFVKVDLKQVLFGVRLDLILGNAGSGGDINGEGGGLDTGLVSEGRRPIDRGACLLYTSPSPRDQRGSRMPSSA